jgi:glycosyltransferase involved in cell wall biosynthesis
MKAPEKIYLCDHLLRGRRGHHLGYNLALVDAARRVGCSVELITHREFDLSLSQGCPAKGIFHTDYRFDPPRWLSRNQRFLGGLTAWSTFRFARDLKRFPAPRSSDAIFAQMIAPRHFLGWLHWFESQKDSPVLFLHLGYAPEKFTTPEIAGALHRLSPKLQRRLFLVTDSEKMVPAFEGILKIKVHHLPHLISYDIPAPASRQESDALVVFAPGNARREKGFCEVFRVVDSLIKSGTAPGLRFVLQCHDPDAVCAGLLKNGPPALPGVEWIPVGLSDDEYSNRLSKADVILLPYHLDQYSKRTSGIFCEARVAGKPVITTRGSWAGDRVMSEGGGWLIDEKNDASLINVLRSLSSDFVLRSSEACALSDSAFSEFHRDSFMKGLLDLFSQAT